MNARGEQTRQPRLLNADRDFQKPNNQQCADAAEFSVNQKLSSRVRQELISKQELLENARVE